MTEEVLPLGGNKIAVSVACMMAAFMAYMDIAIVNVALNDIRGSLGTPLDQIGWVSTGYMMANVVVIPITGWLQRRLGFRLYITASLLFFTASSALCATAWNLSSLVVFRLLQGCGGGAIIPTTQAILLGRYPRAQHGLASGIYAVGAVCGPLLGPSLGGYLTNASSWHLIFLINVPFGILASGLLWTQLREPGFKPSRAKVDGFGLALLAVGMPATQYVLEEGHREDWFESRLIIFLSVVAVISLVTLVVHELEHEDPIVDLRLFANVKFAAGAVVTFLLGVAFFTGVYLFSLYCGAVLHYSALDIGILFLAPASVQLFVMPLVGRFSDKLGERRLMAFGIVLLSLGMWMNTHLGSTAGPDELRPPLFIRYFSFAFIFIPLSLVTLSDLPAARRGNGSGLLNLIREVGGTIGTAWISTTLDTRQRLHFVHLSEHVSLYDPLVIEELRSMRVIPGARTIDPQAASVLLLHLRVAQQALVRAFDDAFLLVAVGFACSLFLVVFLKRGESNAPAGAADLH